MFRRRRSADDFDAELRSHLELETDELKAEGCTEQEAGRRARVAFGSVEATRERFYARGHALWIENLGRDFRFALRSLGKNLRFTTLAVLALSLGIGSATVIFSAVYGVILNTFPFKDPDQVTSFGIRDLSGSGNNLREWLSVPEFLDYREQTGAFSDISGEYGGFDSTPVEYTAEQNTWEFSADFMSVNSFAFFGVTPEVGRLPTAQDTRAGATPVFTMSDKLWRRQFNADPGIVGRSFRLSGVARTLVGIMPSRFRWGWADLWIPFPVDRAQVDADPALLRQSLWCVGRLKPGVTLAQAEADLNLVAHRRATIDPQHFPRQFTVTATRLSDRVVGPFRELLYPLLGAVLMLLLIACSNVANLILTRATVRKREMAVRAALGASRGRMVQQFLMESFVLAAAGCAAGCLLGYLGIRALVPAVPYNAFPQEAVINLNPVVLLFSAGIALLATLVSSAVPALRVLRDDPQFHLISSSRGTGSNTRQGKGRAALVVAEVALSIVLLIGTGLMARTFLALTHVPLGFDPDHVLAAGLVMPEDAFPNAERRNEFVSELLDHIAALPGVAAAGDGLTAPPNVAGNSGVTIPGSGYSEHRQTALDLVNEGYFRTLGFQLLRGRLLSRSDVNEVHLVAVINAAFARRFFPGQDPIGRQLEFDLPLTGEGSASAPRPTFEIVGVVEDEQNNALTEPPQPEVFLPYTLPINGGGYTLLVRTQGDPEKLMPALRHILWTLDPQVALADPASVRSLLERDTFANPRFESLVLGVFALTGTLLVVIGIYSVMAYTVSLRTQEMGVRVALGADRGDILHLILGRGMLLVAIGAGLGLLGSLALTRYLAHMIWGVSVRDPWTYAVVIVGVGAMGLVSCISPARRATRIDPAVALRSD